MINNNANRPKEALQRFLKKREKRHVKNMTPSCKFLNIQKVP